MDLSKITFTATLATYVILLIITGLYPKYPLFVFSGILSRLFLRLKFSIFDLIYLVLIIFIGIWFSNIVLKRIAPSLYSQTILGLQGYLLVLLGHIVVGSLFFLLWLALISIPFFISPWFILFAGLIWLSEAGILLTISSLVGCLVYVIGLNSSS